MPRISAPDPIKYLVNRKYPQTRPTLARIIDHVDSLPDPANPLLRLVEDSEMHREPGLSPEAEAYRKQLCSLPEEELDTLYRQELKNQHEEDDKGRFFNQPNAQADFDHYSRMPYWKLEEALALSFGKNPELVYWSRLEKVPYWVSPFAEQYRKLRDLAQRAKAWGQLYDPVAPGIFIGWMERNDISFPAELKELVIARGNHIIDWKAKYDELAKTNDKSMECIKELLEEKNQILDDFQAKLQQLAEQKNNTKESIPEKSLSTRERETVLKMIVGMAIDAYGYDPHAGKSPTAKEVEGILDGLGIPVSDDTIRKWLKEGAELIPSSGE